MNLAKTVRIRRIKRNLSVIELAAAVKRSRQSIHDIEAGRTKQPGIDMIRALEGQLGPLIHLVGGR